ncbi:MAG TPA: FG-GAP-like repeat-containing protein, partial [Pyrinomonadaceae bacterium]|nr:FG-GAP-like repeat-containing protein [Pyrinomonadaceae bacterium]
GRFMVCGSRLINNETHWISHRLTADGTPDPSFRITSATGSCLDLAVQTDGKVIISASFQNPNNSYQERVQRFNSDGTRDMSFSGHNFDSIARKIKLLPNGKVMVAYDFSSGQNNYSKIFRLNSDGSLDREFATCGVNSSTTTAFLPLDDGSVMMSGCSKWSTGPVYQFSKTRTDGSIQPDLDNISVTGNIKEIESAGNGKYYVYGLFSQINGVSRARIARLQPYTAPIKAKFDFDGDGRSDISVFRPSDRYWYINQSTAGGFFFPWGLSTDKPFASDYDNDGKYDPGMVRASTWYLLTSSTGYGYDHFQLGLEQGKPMGGDFDGDNKHDWAMRRSNLSGANWLVTLNAQRGFSYATESIPGEAEEDLPVVGDFDGDGRDEIGSFSRGNWKTRDYAPGAPTSDFRWGLVGDIPTPGDYDGDGITDFAIYRPSRGEWWINQSRDGVFAATFGLDGDIPVPADYDGDGKTDIAIFRNGEWWQFLSATGTFSAQQWGLPGDIPIPAQ